MEEKRNNETFLEYAIRILDEDNVSENGLIDTYYMLFQDVDHISYDNAQRQLRGIRKFRDKIKKENNNIVLEKQNSSNIDISINSDGTQTRNALLVLSEEEIKTPELLLKAHGYSSKDFELVSSKNSMWHQNSNTNGLTTLYCSNLMGNIIIESETITTFLNCFHNTTSSKVTNVYIPYFYRNYV